MLEKFKCSVCSRMVSMDTDDPLHFTNWSLPSKLSKPVCSKLCRDVVLKEYELAVARSFAVGQSTIEECKQRILLLYVMLDDWLDDGKIPTDVEDGWVKSLWRNIEDTVNPET